MSNWPATKAKRVLAALERIGWGVKRQVGSHKLLVREGWPDYEFAFHNPLNCARGRQQDGRFRQVQELWPARVASLANPPSLSLQSAMEGYE